MERVKERAKTLWHLVKGNLTYDLLKTTATSLWPWIAGTLVTGIVVFRAYISSQPPGFFAMLLVFGAAFFLTAVALQKKYQPEPNLQFSRRWLSAVAVLIFLGVPVILFVLSRIPFNRENSIEIASPRQHDPVSPKVEEPKIEEPKTEDKPPAAKTPERKVRELKSKNAITKKSESTKDVKPRETETKPPVSNPTEQRSEGPNSPNIVTHGPNSPVTIGPNSPVIINPQHGWQNLTDQDLANNVALLSPFAGQTVKIWIPNATENQYALVNQLKVLLERSNWKILDLQNIMEVGGGPTYGVRMRANSITPALEAIAKPTIRRWSYSRRLPIRW